MARKKIKKVSVAPIDAITGSIVDSTNIADKTVNTYSANVIDKFNAYSATEQVVGTFNGVKLYRKAVSVKTPTTSTEGTSVTSNISIVSMNISAILKYEAFLIDGSTYFNLPLVTSGTSSTWVYIDPSNIHIRNSQKYYSDKTVRIILEYTKTTD